MQKKKSRFLVHIFHHSHDSNHRNDTNNINNNNNMKRRKNNNVWAYVYAVCKHNLIHKYNHDTASTISKHNCNSRASLTIIVVLFFIHSEIRHCQSYSCFFHILKKQKKKLQAS